MKELHTIQPPQHHLSIFFDNFHPRPVTRHFWTAPLMKWKEALKAGLLRKAKSHVPVSRSVVTVVTGVTRSRCRCHKTVNTDSDNVTLNVDTDTGWYRCRYRVIHIDNRYRHPDVDTDTARHHVGSQAGLRQGSFIVSPVTLPPPPRVCDI